MTNGQRGAQAPQNQALVVAPIDTAQQAIALVPQSLDGAMHLARWLATSSFLPDALKGKEGDIFAMVLAGAELGLPPMAALRGMYIVNGKTAMESKTKAAICIQRGAAVYFRRTEHTALATTWETLRRGETEPRLSRYTKAEADQAGLTSKAGPWKSYPQRMISHRALGWLCDDAYPDVVLGVATAEDFDDDDRVSFSPIAAVGPGVELGAVQARPAVQQSSAPPPPPPPQQKPAAPPQDDRPPLNSDQLDDLVEAISKCGTEAALKEVGKQIRAAVLDDAGRARLTRAYEGQLAEVRAANAAEAGAKP